MTIRSLHLTRPPFLFHFHSIHKTSVHRCPTVNAFGHRIYASLPLYHSTARRLFSINTEPQLIRSHFLESLLNMSSSDDDVPLAGRNTNGIKTNGEFIPDFTHQYLEFALWDPQLRKRAAIPCVFHSTSFCPPYERPTLISYVHDFL